MTSPNGPDLEDLSTVANGTQENQEPPATSTKASEAPADAKVTKPKDSEAAAAPTPDHATEHPATPTAAAAASKQDDQPREKQPAEPPSSTPVTNVEQGKQDEPVPSPSVAKADVPVTSSRDRETATSTRQPTPSASKAADVTKTRPSVIPVNSSPPAKLDDSDAASTPSSSDKRPATITAAKASEQAGQLKETPSSLATEAHAAASSLDPEPTASMLDGSSRPSPSLSKTTGLPKARLSAAVSATPSAPASIDSEFQVPSLSQVSESTESSLKESSSPPISISLSRLPLSTPVPSSESSDHLPADSSTPTSTSTDDPSITSIRESTKTRLSLPTSNSSTPPGIDSSEPSAHSIPIPSSDVSAVSSAFASTSTDADVPSVSPVPGTTASQLSTPPDTSVGSILSSESTSPSLLFTSAAPSDIFSEAHSSVIASVSSVRFSLPQRSQSATISSSGSQPVLTSDVSTFNNTESSPSTSLELLTTTIPSPASTNPQVSLAVAPLKTLSISGSAPTSAPASMPTSIRHRRPLTNPAPSVPAFEVSSTQDAGPTDGSTLTTSTATSGDLAGSNTTPSPELPESGPGDSTKHNNHGSGGDRGAGRTRSPHPQPTNEGAPKVSEDNNAPKADQGAAQPSQPRSTQDANQGGTQTHPPQSQPTHNHSQKGDKGDNPSTKTNEGNHGAEATQPPQPQSTHAGLQKDGKDVNPPGSQTTKDSHDAGHTEAPQPQPTDDDPQKSGNSGKAPDGGQGRPPQQSSHDGSQDGKGNHTPDTTKGDNEVGHTEAPQPTHDDPQKDDKGNKPPDSETSKGSHDAQQPTNDGSQESGKGGKDNLPTTKTSENSPSAGITSAPQPPPTNDGEQKGDNSGGAPDDGQTQHPQPTHDGSHEDGKGGKDDNLPTKTTGDDHGAGQTQAPQQSPHDDPRKSDNFPESKTISQDAGRTQTPKPQSTSGGQQKNGKNDKESNNTATPPQASETTKDNQGTKPTSPPNPPLSEGNPDNTKGPLISATKDTQGSKPTASPVPPPGFQKGGKQDDGGPKKSSDPAPPNASGLGNQGANSNTPSLSSSMANHSDDPTPHASKAAGVRVQDLGTGDATSAAPDQLSPTSIVTSTEVPTTIFPSTTIVQTLTIMNGDTPQTLTSTVIVTSAPLTTVTSVPTTIPVPVPTGSPISTNSGSTTSIGAIVGGVVGGILILVAAMIMFLCMRRRRRIQLQNDAVANQMTGAFSSQMPTVVISSQRSVSATSPPPGNGRSTRAAELAATHAPSTTSPSLDPSESISIRSPRSPTNIPAQRRKPVPGYGDTDLVDLASDLTARVSSTTSSSALSMEFWTPLNNPYGNTRSAAASDPFRDPDPPNTNKHSALAALALSDDPFKDPVQFNAPGQKRLSAQSTSSSQRSVSPQFGFAV